MKGFVPTPRETVDTMVDLLFRGRMPAAENTILDPGCGTGEFIDGIIRWCQRRRLPLPRITGVESDPRHLPALRTKYRRVHTISIEHADFLLVREDTFGALVTYPAITVVSHLPPGRTQVVRRDGSTSTVTLPTGSDPWLPLLEGIASEGAAVRLADLCLRVSCGLATGADNVFVRPTEGLDPAFRPFAHPTIAGRELAPPTTDLTPRFVMLIPYGLDGRLMPLRQLGAMRSYLLRHEVRRRLLARTCVKRKPWYAFHETPVLRDILRPKILCKDIGEAPHFWIDRSGEIVPRHSVYYIVPRESAAIDVIADYLRSPAAHEWLRRNCQRAAKGYLRLQSHILQRLPVPDNVARAATGGRHVLGPGGRFLQGELSFR